MSRMGRKRRLVPSDGDTQVASSSACATRRSLVIRLRLPTITTPQNENTNDVEHLVVDVGFVSSDDATPTSPFLTLTGQGARLPTPPPSSPVLSSKSVIPGVYKGVQLNENGKENYQKLYDANQLHDDVKAKACFGCKKAMDWRLGHPIRFDKGKYIYSVYHNGECLKVGQNDKKSIAVSEGRACHHSSCARFFAEDATPFLSENEHWYCDEDCYDNYRAKIDEAKELAAYLKSIGKCPGNMDHGCKEGNDAVVNRIYCALCRDLVDTHNSNNYEALRECYARSKNRPEPSTTIYEFLSSHRQSVVAALSRVKHILLSKRVVIWDTENDGRGGTYNIEKTREWFLFKLETNEVLHIRRDNPGYSISSAARQFLEFIEDVDHLVAYEPKSCDRNRAKELLGDETYKKIGHKFVDLYRLTSSVIDTKPHSTTKAYVQDRMLPTVYEYFFPNDFVCHLPLLEVPDKITDNRDKSKWDVYRLCNLFLVIRSLVSNE